MHFVVGPFPGPALRGDAFVHRAALPFFDVMKYKFIEEILIISKEGCNL